MRNLFKETFFISKILIAWSRIHFFPVRIRFKMKWILQHHYKIMIIYWLDLFPEGFPAHCQQYTAPPGEGARQHRKLIESCKNK